MKEEGNNKSKEFSEFQRYVRGEMTNREENAFRKRNRNDPFAEESAESPSDISSRETTDVMIHGSKQHKKLVKSGKKIVLITGASIIVLVIISSVFVILSRNKTALQFNNNLTKPIPQEATLPDHKSDPVLSESVQANDTVGIKAIQEIADADTIKTSSNSLEIQRIADNSVTPAIAEVNDSDSYIPENKTSAPASVLNDSALKTENNQTGHISAQPLTGSSEFKKYIDDNIIRPPNQSQGEEAVAVVSFVVLTTGTIDSIRVISSPGDEFAKEAIRLIREGPAWKPATDNGFPVNEEVTLRIVFK
jgi:TonB family protein